MEEHQNNPETYLEESGAGSGEDGPKVIRAGSGGELGQELLRTHVGQDDAQVGISDAGTTEAARNILRAGRQALESAEAAATETAVEVGKDKVGTVLSEWSGTVGRTSSRTIQAFRDLMHCHTFYGLLQWQHNLMSATVADLVATNVRMLQLVARKD